MKPQSKKGSLTIEASLALPIFIFAIVFVMYFIKILHIQENMQHALDQTANEIAMYAYVYDQTGIKDIQQNAYKQYKSESGDVNQQIDQILTNGSDAIQNIQELIQIKDRIHTNETVNKTPNDLTPNDLTGFIKGYKQQIQSLTGQIQSQITSVVGNVTHIAESIQSVLANKDQVMAYGKQEGFEYIINTIGNQGAQHIFHTYMTEEEIEGYYIVDGIRGLDFSRSQYLLETDDIDLAMTYSIKMPIPLRVVEEVPLIQRVKVRAWTGNKNRTQADNNSDNDANPNENEEVVVYISARAQGNETIVYHTNPTCYHIYKEPTQIPFKEIGHKSSCNRCSKHAEPDLEDLVYITDGGAHYHVDGNCTAITREVITIALEDLPNGRECQVCQQR
ncbi:TadE-like protein [Natranaerovirga hydrolytica]|uniref:TadE-like protein n=1 Tax=Natranaerovirga hydrolytica TaxID=680378 RepID=A0A4R1MK52_9FIRM|nr:TadE/TadG family type IV pilus assembly protein [Natranaerovirga hydrolytica]TCK93106.1 TadE-like protein [Natranaerovirga hydrolytica]